MGICIQYCCSSGKPKVIRKTSDPPSVCAQKSEGSSWNGDTIFQKTDSFQKMSASACPNCQVVFQFRVMG